MAYYLVTARALPENLAELKQRLEAGEVKAMRPFGIALDVSLRNAKLLPGGLAIWEETDYCTPPLAMERAAVLDTYFEAIEVEEVQKDEGWRRIAALDSMWENMHV